MGDAQKQRKLLFDVYAAIGKAAQKQMGPQRVQDLRQKVSEIVVEGTMAALVKDECVENMVLEPFVWKLEELLRSVESGRFKEMLEQAMRATEDGWHY